MKQIPFQMAAAMLPMGIAASPLTGGFHNRDSAGADRIRTPLVSHTAMFDDCIYCEATVAQGGGWWISFQGSCGESIPGGVVCDTCEGDPGFCDPGTFWADSDVCGDGNCIGENHLLYEEARADIERGDSRGLSLLVSDGANSRWATLDRDKRQVRFKDCTGRVVEALDVSPELLASIGAN